MNILAIFLPHISLEDLLSKTMVRLALAAVLGGIIGLEREFKRAGRAADQYVYMLWLGHVHHSLTELASDLGSATTRALPRRSSLESASLAQAPSCMPNAA